MNSNAKIPPSEETSDRTLDVMNADSSFQKKGTAIVGRHANHEVAHTPYGASHDASLQYNNKSLIALQARQSIIESHTFPYLRIQREAEERKKKVQLTNVVIPHDHDVLCGRGNFVNYHRGNQYYRSLVRKYFLQYVASPKPDKPKYALLIYHEIRMQDPPGRFLRQDAGTKMWHDVGERKALDKTRQALREGAPDAKSHADLESLECGGVFETKNSFSGGNADASSFVEGPISSIDHTGYDVNKKADHRNSSNNTIPQTAILSGSYHTNEQSRQRNVPPHINLQCQTSNHPLYESPNGHKHSQKGNQLSCETPHAQHEAQHELQLNAQPFLQQPHANKCGQNNHSSYGPPNSHHQSQHSHQSPFEILLSQQQFQQSNLLPSKPRNAQRQEQQNNESSFKPQHAQHQHKQSNQSNFEPQQRRQSDQSSAKMPIGNESLSFMNAVASKITEANGVRDDNLLKMLVAMTTSANGGLVENESLVQSVASKIATAKGVDTSGSLVNSVIARLQDPMVAKCVGEKIIALLNSTLMNDNSTVNPSSLSNTIVTNKSDPFPASSTVTRNLINKEAAAHKSADNVNAAETTLNTPTLDSNSYCSHTKSVTAANVLMVKDTMADITAAGKVAYPEDSNVRRETMTNDITSGTAKSQKILANESLLNTMKLSIAAQTVNRARKRDNVIESNKRCKTSSTHDPSIVKDSVAALLAMSHGDDLKTRDASFDGDCGSVSKSIDKTKPLRKRKHCSGAWSSTSLGNVMQCDRCLGAGTLPMPASVLSDMQYTPRDNVTCETPMFANINLKSSLANQSTNSSSIVKIEDEESKTSDLSSKDLYDVCPGWTERICNAEKKWGIEHDNSQPYPQRIEAIEKKNLEYREVFRSSNALSQELEAEDQRMSDDSFTKRYLRKVEDAEKKWGLSVPKGFNLVERIEMVEGVVSSYNRRLHRCL